jgi:hypothetical protein
LAVSGNFVRPARSFAFFNVNSRDVFIAIHWICSNGIGLDEMPLRFIKIFLPSIFLVITHIFNTSIISGCFPASWKIFKVIPVAKVPDLLEPGHFRSISILPALSRALEIVMMDQMVAYLTDVRALSPLQSGFRLGQSTVTALLNITDDIYGMLDLGYFVALCQKLESRYGFSSSAMSFLSLYLSLRFQCV